VAGILSNIAREAGYSVASKYHTLIERLYAKLADYPEGFQTRPKLGPHVRVGIVYPYLVIYRHVRGEDTVSIVRVVDGRRKITRELLQEK
jgi:toxin ParE1/3/4